jgi:hypothetical protein
MKKHYEVVYQKDGKPFKLRGWGDSEAEMEGKTLLYLLEKHQSKIEIISVEEYYDEPLEEYIVRNLQKIGHVRYDEHSLEAAEQLEKKIRELLESTDLIQRFDLVRYGLAIHCYSWSVEEDYF